MKALLTALLAGLLFGVGLCVSGMSDPKNILAFLDFAGHWSPNLAGVMLGAIVVHATWLLWTAKAKGVPLASSPPAARHAINASLLGGSALFGVGWGLSGYCPGPSVVALGSGASSAVVFLLAVLAGIALHRVLTQRRAAPEERIPSATAS